LGRNKGIRAMESTNPKKGRTQESPRRDPSYRGIISEVAWLKSAPPTVKSMIIKRNFFIGKEKLMPFLGFE
jgi:hypothetical protein